MAGRQHRECFSGALRRSPAHKVLHGLVASLTACVGLSACLQLNADFKEFPHPADDNQTLVRISTTEELNDWSTSKQDIVSTRPNDPLQSHPSQAPPLTSSPSTQVIVASASDNSLGSQPINTSSSVASSSSGDSSASTTSLQQEIWIPLEITNPSPDHALLDGTSILLSFDHASLVTAGRANPDGSNLRIMARDNGVWTQLHRVLDPESQWNHTDTQIWLSLDRVIPVNQKLTEHFYLVVHSEAGALEDPSKVFLLYDDFSGPALDTTKWNAVQSSTGPGSSSSTVTNGQLSIQATSTGGDSLSHRVMSSETWKLDAVAVDASLRAREHIDRRDCTQEILTAFWNTHQPPLLNAAWVQKRQELHFVNSEDFGGALVTQRSSAPLGGSSTHRYSSRWVDTKVELWRNDALLDTKTPDSVVTRPNQHLFRIGFEAIGVGGACTNVQSEVVVDWVMVRKLSLVQPQLQLNHARQTTSRPL